MDKTNILKSSFWVTIGNFSRRFFALLSNLALVRILAPSDFGIIGIAYVFWSFFTIFTQNVTSLYILYKGINDKKYLDTAYTIGIGFGLFTSSLLFFGSSWIADFLNVQSLSQLLNVYALNLILVSIYGSYSAVLMQEGKYTKLAINTFLASILRLVFTIGAALLGFRYWSFAIGDAAFWLTDVICVIFQSTYRLKIKFYPKIAREVFRFCLGATSSGFGFYANSNLDNFVVGKVLGTVSLGYYNLAYQLSMAISTILNPVLIQVGTPKFSKIDSDRKQELALFSVTQQISYVVTPVYALIFLTIDKQFTSLCFGTEWTAIIYILPWLLISSYFKVINGPLRTMLSAKGIPGINAKVNLTIAPFAVTSFYVGAKLGGVIGVSIAAAISLGLVWTTVWWITGCRVLKWSIRRFFSILIPITLAAPIACICYPFPFLIKQLIFLLVFFVGMRFLVPASYRYYLGILKYMHKFISKKLHSVFF